MADVTVDIAGRTHRLGCNDGEEAHLVALAHEDAASSRPAVTVGIVDVSDVAAESDDRGIDVAHGSDDESDDVVADVAAESDDGGIDVADGLDDDGRRS